MAFIGGVYTSSSMILKDIARSLASANLIKEPTKKEILEVKSDIDGLYLESSLYGYKYDIDLEATYPNAHNIKFYSLLNVLRNDIIQGVFDDSKPYRINITGPIVEGDKILVEYDIFKDSVIIYPTVRTNDGAGGADFTTELDQIEDQLNRITDEQRFVIKMTTTPEKKPIKVDPFNEDPDHDIRNTTMYVEFRKTKFIINHETMDYDSTRINEAGEEEVFTMKNNHHFFIRMIDKMNEVTGELLPTSIVSNWAKMAWSLDYEELITIEPDTDVTFEGIATDLPPTLIKSRLIAKELPRFCNAENMYVKFWVHCDNDKINLVIRGNDDIAINDYLVSYAYIGKIQGFVNPDNGYTYANDLLGNFALTTGSSTIPLEYPRELPPNSMDVDMNSVLKELKAFDGSDTGINSEKGPFSVKLSIKEFRDPSLEQSNIFNFLNFEAPRVMFNYRISFYGDGFETSASNILSSSLCKYMYRNRNEEIEVGGFKPELLRGDDLLYRTDSVQYRMEPKLFINIPVEIQSIVKGVKIYKSIPKVWDDEDESFYFGMFSGSSNTTFDKKELGAIESAALRSDRFYLIDQYELQSGDIIDETFIYSDLQASIVLEENENFIQRILTVERYDDDRSGGAIKAMRFSNRFGIDSTATGVSDVMMFKTRLGSYYQKHFVSFMTPNEMLNKHGFNVSRWTDRVHITPVSIVHPGDGYRGEMMDVLFLTQTNMKNGDILIINEGGTDEKKYMFFKVTAPFSCLKTSADFNSGIAIRYHKYE